MLESRYDLKVFFPSTSLICSSLLVLLEFHCALRFEYFSNFRFVSHNVLFLQFAFHLLLWRFLLAVNDFKIIDIYVEIIK